MLSTYCFAHLTVICFEIVSDWKLSLTRLLRLFSFATQITKCPFCPLIALGQSDQGFFLPCKSKWNWTRSSLHSCWKTAKKNGRKKWMTAGKIQQHIGMWGLISIKFFWTPLPINYKSCILDSKQQIKLESIIPCTFSSDTLIMLSLSLSAVLNGIPHPIALLVLNDIN